jgi:glycosyltransferase involved in cell wall biosynthesis
VAEHRIIGRTVGQRAQVVHLCLGLGMGGMEKLLVEFARHADRNRFDLHFVSMTSKGCTADEIESLGWPVISLDHKSGLRPAMVFRIAKLLRDLKADLVHTHNTKPLLYGAPAARLAGVSGVIHTRHGQRIGAKRRQTTMFTLAARCADRIVAVSDDGAGLTASEGLPESKLVTIRNGIDLSRFSFVGPRACGPAVTVGRLSPEKDIQTLLRAAAIVSEQEPGFRLRVLGSGLCMRELEQLRDQLDLRGHVEFPGQVNDVAAELAGASLFVMSSLTEGISLALLEAMALGLPAVVTRVGGNVEVVTDGETGLLVPERSPELLAQAMLRVYREPALARDMGLAGRRRVENCFDARQMIARYESLYQEALGGAISISKAA